MLAIDLSILIVTYRNPELTRACLRSVYEQTRDVSFEVIVVDNASDDGTPEMIAAEFPAVRLIRRSENLGFARANNLAARAARGDYLLLLNPDTIVLDRAAERLLAYARADGRRGLYGGRTLRPDGSLDPKSCWGSQTPWSVFCFATGLDGAFQRNALLDPESLGRWPRDSERDVGVVTGCLLLVRRSDWEELGGFDERFEMYGEDADLAMRARRHGMRVAVTPAATIIHAVGASSASNAAKGVMVMRSRATIIRKHWSAPARAFGLGCLLAGVLLRAIAVRVRGRRSAGPWPELWRARQAWIAGYPSTSS